MVLQTRRESLVGTALSASTVSPRLGMLIANGDGNNLAPAGQHIRWFTPRSLSFPKNGFDVFRIEYEAWGKFRDNDRNFLAADFRPEMDPAGNLKELGQLNWSRNDRVWSVHPALDLIFPGDSDIGPAGGNSIQLLNAGAGRSFMLHFRQPVLFVQIVMSLPNGGGNRPLVGFYHSAPIFEADLQEDMRIEQPGLTDLLIPLVFDQLIRISFILESAVVEAVNRQQLGKHIVTIKLPATEVEAYELLRPDVEAGIVNRMLKTNTMADAKNEYPEKSVRQLVASMRATVGNPSLTVTSASSATQMPFEFPVVDHIRLAMLDPNIARMLASYWVDRELGDYLYMISATYDPATKKVLHGFGFTRAAAGLPQIDRPAVAEQLSGIDYRGVNPEGRVGLYWNRTRNNYRNPAKPVFADIERSMGGNRVFLTKPLPYLISTSSKYCFHDSVPVNNEVVYHITPIDLFGRSGPVEATAALKVKDLEAPVPPKNIRAVVEQKAFPWQRPALRKEPEIKQGSLRATAEFGEAQRRISPDAKSIRWLWCIGPLGENMALPAAWNEIAREDLAVPLSGNVNWTTGDSPVDFRITVQAVRPVNSKLLELLIDRPLLEPGVFDGFQLVMASGNSIVHGSHAGIRFSDDRTERQIQTARLVVDRTPHTQAIQPGSQIQLVHPLSSRSELHVQGFMQLPEDKQIEGLERGNPVVRVTLQAPLPNEFAKVAGGEFAIDYFYRVILGGAGAPSRILPVSQPGQGVDVQRLVVVGRLVSDVETNQGTSIFFLRMKPADFLRILLIHKTGQAFSSTARFHPPIVLPQKSIGLNGEPGDIKIQLQPTERYISLWLTATTIDNGGMESSQVAPPFEMRVHNPPPLVRPNAPYPEEAGALAEFGEAAPPDRNGRSTVRVAWDPVNQQGVRYELARALDTTIIAADRDRWLRGDTVDHFAALGIQPGLTIKGTLKAGTTMNLAGAQAFQVKVKTHDAVNGNSLVGMIGRIEITHTMNGVGKKLYHRLLKGVAENGEITLLCQPFFELSAAALGTVAENTDFTVQAAPDYSAVLADENQVRQLADVDFTAGSLAGEGRNDSAFGIVTGVPITSTSFVDTIPGIGSSGYYYKVRAVFAGEVRSDWSDTSVAFRQIELSVADVPEVLRFRRIKNLLVITLLRPTGRGVRGLRLLTGGGLEQMTVIDTFTFIPQGNEKQLSAAHFWPEGGLIDLRPTTNGTDFKLDTEPKITGLFDVDVDRDAPPEEDNLLVKPRLISNIIEVNPAPPPDRTLAVQVEQGGEKFWLDQIDHWVEIVLQDPPATNTLFVQTVKEVVYHGLTIVRDSRPVSVGGNS